MSTIFYKATETVAIVANIWFRCQVTDVWPWRGDSERRWTKSFEKYWIGTRHVFKVTQGYILILKGTKEKKKVRSHLVLYSTLLKAPSHNENTLTTKVCPRRNNVIHLRHVFHVKATTAAEQHLYLELQPMTNSYRTTATHLNEELARMKVTLKLDSMTVPTICLWTHSKIAMLLRKLIKYSNRRTCS